VPLAITLLRLSPSTQWRDDLSVVRGLGMVPVGAEGVVSSVLMQLGALLPLGGRLLRAALVSAIGLALAGRLAFALARRLLASDATRPVLGCVLALAASLTVSLAPTWQVEGTIAGGATLAAALVFAALLLRPGSEVTDARVWLGYGALTGITVLESHAAGAALLVALVAQMVATADLPPRRSVILCAVGAVVAVSLCLVPMVVRPLASRAWVDLGYELSSSGIAAVDTAAEQPGALAAWLGEVGVVSVGFALVGAGWGLLRRRTRWLVAPLVALVAADAVFPASSAGVLATDALTPVRLCAVGALAVAAALGVQAVVLALSKLKVPFARPAAVLIVVFDFTLVLLAAEDSAFLADRSAQRGAEVWTDEALGSLPPKSLLLVRSEAIAWRLWAARVVRGERPDLVVVPLHLLERGSVAKRVLQLEPELADLIRDVAIGGVPSEYALSTLADVRPLYVEITSSWDERLLDHLIPEPLWLRFAPHAVGRSDRVPSLRRGRSAFARVLEKARTPQHRDEATLSVLAAHAREQAVALAALGDRTSVTDVLHDLTEIRPEDPFLAEMQQRLAQRSRGREEMLSLLQ